MHSLHASNTARVFRPALRRVFASAVAMLLVVVVTPQTPAAAAGRCGLTGEWQALSSTLVYDKGGSGVVPDSTRHLVLKGNRWVFGSSSGTFEVKPITARDWATWGIASYGPTTKMVLKGWQGGTGQGPIEMSQVFPDAVDFFWVIYRTKRPASAGTAQIKYGHFPTPTTC